MRYNQQKYYFNYGLRAHIRLLKPRMIPMGKFNLPLESVFQYFESNTAVVGPSPQDRLFQTEGGRLFIEHVKELNSTLGNPRRTVLSPITLENDYRRMNRVFKPLRKDQALTIMNKNVLVVNYNMLNPLYRYVASYKATYHRWYNNSVTFWDHVIETHNRFKWNQYIEFEVPATVPNRGRWDQFSTAVNQTTLEQFPTAAHLTAADLYKWLGDKREDSLLSRVPAEVLNKVNLLFRLRSHFFVLNLGLLDSWRKGPNDRTGKGLTTTEIQMRFVRLMKGLNEFVKDDVELGEDEEGLFIDLSPKVAEPVAKTSIREKVVVDDVPMVVEDDEEQEETPIRAEDDVPLDLLPGLDMDPVDIPDPVNLQDLDNTNVFDDLDLDEEPEPVGQTLADITDEDDEEPETFADQLLGDPNVRGIALRAFEMAETGVITHRAMNRAIDDATSFKSLPDPYHSGQTIEQAMKLADDDLQLPPTKTFRNRTTVIDKSMLSTKLKEMNRKYVTKVMRKDILQAVVAIQKQGVAIKDYKVEVVRDAMNHFEIHSVTIKPIRGRQTTVRFRIPVVDKDGRFVSNGVQYRAKLQRAD